MGLFNKYFGSKDQKKIGELTVPQIMKFIHELSIQIDVGLFNKYESGCHGFLSEDEINEEELSEFRVNILVHTIFGYAHNEHYNIKEYFVNMPLLYKESIYAKSYLALCSLWANNRRIIDEIVKTTNIKYNERIILVIISYTQEVIYRLETYLTIGIGKCVDNKYDIENISEFKSLYFLFNNPSESFPPSDIEYITKYNIDEEDVNLLALNIMDVYRKAKELLSDGN